VGLVFGYSRHNNVSNVSGFCCLLGIVNGFYSLDILLQGLTMDSMLRGRPSSDDVCY
jgi:hypothetical protein